MVRTAIYVDSVDRLHTLLLYGIHLECVIIQKGQCVFMSSYTNYWGDSQSFYQCNIFVLDKLQPDSSLPNPNCTLPIIWIQYMYRPNIIHLLWLEAIKSYTKRNYIWETTTYITIFCFCSTTLLMLNEWINIKFR